MGLLLAFILLSLSIHPVLSFSHNDLSTRSPSGSKTVIIQMFEWNWDSVAAECTNFIGPAGYGFVQGLLFLFFFKYRSLANALVL